MSCSDNLTIYVIMETIQPNQLHKKAEDLELFIVATFIVFADYIDYHAILS